MALADDIRSYLAGPVGAKVGGKGDSGEAKLIVAQQKSFLSKKTVEYQVRFKVDERERVVRFFEMLKESGTGMSGSDVDGFGGGGWGVSKETYSSGAGGREGSIESQASMLGKKYDLSFDYGQIRHAVQALAESNGYGFDYRLTPKGL